MLDTKKTKKTDDFPNSMEFPRFEVPSFVLPPVFRAFAENQVIQGKETLETLSSAVREAYSTGLNGFNEYSRKIAEAGHQDADAVRDCCRELIAAKSVPEVMDVWTNRAPRHLSAMSSRTGELWALYWKVATDTAKPIAAGMSHTFGRSNHA
jgi:hypothetical protein